MSYSKIVFSVLVGLLMISCTTDSGTDEEEKPKVEEPPVEEPITWEEQGLRGIEVFTLAQAGDYLLAGTEEGLYRAFIFDQLGWQYMGPGQDSVRVTDLIVFSEQELMAAAGGSKVVYKSEDLGETWEGWALDIPDETDHRNRLEEIEVNTENPDILFGLSGSVLRSEDAGQTWKRTNSGGMDFLYVSEEYPNQVWAGGSTAAMVPRLVKSDDGGETWTLLNSKVNDTGGFDATAVTISPENEDIVLAGVGDHIQKSEDGGETWETVVEGYDLSLLQNSQMNTNKVYSALFSSWDVYLGVSNDYGNTWEIVKIEELPDGLRIKNITTIIQDEEEVLYIATNQGMFSYQFEE